MTQFLAHEAAWQPEAIERLVRAPARLAAVRSSSLLDSPPEEDFDSLTKLAVATLGAAASFVSIVDADRDFYKSQVGFPEPLATSRQLTGRNFCHYAISSPGPLVIADTHAETVWNAVPTVATLGVRAYLGVPILVDDQPVGSFCVIDGKPRAWSPSEIEVVEQLSRSASREIRLRLTLSRAEMETDRLRELARANLEMLAVATHDLRSPLQTVILTAALLARSSDVAVQEHAQRLTLASNAMRSLVDELLASATVPAGPPRRQPVSTLKLLNDAAQTMGPIANRASVSLVHGRIDEVTVIVDYAQILRALCNVIGNSIKYCPGSSVTLTAVRAQDTVTLTVEDNGPGIPAVDLPRLFDRGFQGANGVLLEQGEGLGLAIVRSLAEQNGGSALLSSVEGNGTTVSITLPS